MALLDVPSQAQAHYIGCTLPSMARNKTTATELQMLLKQGQELLEQSQHLLKQHAKLAKQLKRLKFDIAKDGKAGRNHFL